MLHCTQNSRLGELSKKLAGPWDSIMKRLVKAYAQHFATWLMAGETDLLALAQLVGGLAFKTKREQEWFKRRFTKAAQDAPVIHAGEE